MKRFKNILYVADETRGDSTAWRRAVSLAKQNHAKLTAMKVVKPVPVSLDLHDAPLTGVELLQMAASESQKQLSELAESAGCSEPVEVIVKIGRAFVEITQEVVRQDYDLLIKSNTKSPGRYQKALFGSLDMQLVRKCPCPVWIVKETETNQYRRILAAVDNDAGEKIHNALNRQILELASSLAEQEGSELHVVHAWELYGEEFLRSARAGLSDGEVDRLVAKEKNSRRQWLENLVNEHSRKAKIHLIKGVPDQAVLSVAEREDIDLVIMGTVGRVGIPGFFMGNTGEDILKEITCSGLTVKPPGFVSPVERQDA